MEIEDFEKIFYKYIEDLKIKLNKEQIQKFYTYMNLLLEWNEKINLTAITEPDEIILKHFIDCLMITKYIKSNDNIIDIGTGAGFPGIPLKIYEKELKITLVDSLNKRLIFLEEVIKKLDLEGINTIHSRAEELGKNKTCREKFNVVTSRAVANLSTLAEYLLPLCKVGGRCICMKSADIEDELNNAKKAIEILGGKVIEKDIFSLPKSNIGRSIIVIEKVKNTPSKFPRKPGIPSKEPII